MLNRTTKRTGAKHRIPPNREQLATSRVGDIESHIAVEHALAQATDEEVHNLQQFVLRQLREHNRLVDTVEELGLEVLFEFLDDLRAHRLVGLVRVALQRKTDRSAGDVFCSEVGRHDDDGVLEVDHATLTVRKAAFFEHLQQRVEDVGVCFFDLVEQHDRERLATNTLGELAALFESDVPGRGSEQSRGSVLLAIFRHVE